MNILVEIFGEEKHVSILQMCARGVVMYVIALILIRIAGLKTFAKSSAFDNVVVIMLGALLSRGVAGDAPFFGVVLSALTMVLMSRIISWIAIKHEGFGRIVKGRVKCLYKDGKINEDNLRKSLLSKSDLMEGIRKEGNTNTLEDVAEVFIECSGALSVVKKKD